MPINAVCKENLAGLVLAGGQGSRMGYVNKGLVAFHSGYLIDNIIALFKAECDYVALSANQDLEQYKQYHIDTWPDQTAFQHCGPLAGVMSCVPHFPEHIEYIQVAPCDSPFLNASVIHTLSDALNKLNTNAVYVKTQSQIYPVIFQFKRTALPMLNAYLSHPGKYSIRKWLALIDAHAVEFKDEALFSNINDIDTLKQFTAH